MNDFTVDDDKPARQRDALATQRQAGKNQV